MNKFSFLFFICVSLLLSSCKTHKENLVYFKDIEKIQTTQLNPYTVKIEPSDELYITVTSQYPQATANYNLPSVNTATREQLVASTQPRQQTYTVDPEGYILFPELGKIYVKGMTVEQLRDYLIEKISAKVENPTVIVELIGYYVNVTGEVKSPGRINITSPRFSILDAIASAGDLTQYGRRDNVLLIREVDGKLEHVRIDLGKSDILESPYYFLKQNDVIYVEPTGVLQENAEYNQINAFKLSVISTIVSGSASIISLIIALTR